MSLSISRQQIDHQGDTLREITKRFTVFFSDSSLFGKASEWVISSGDTATCICYNSCCTWLTSWKVYTCEVCCRWRNASVWLMFFFCNPDCFSPSCITVHVLPRSTARLSQQQLSFLATPRKMICICLRLRTILQISSRSVLKRRNLRLFWRSRSNKKNNIKMSSDMRSVPDSKINRQTK